VFLNCISYSALGTLFLFYTSGGKPYNWEMSAGVTKTTVRDVIGPPRRLESAPEDIAHQCFTTEAISLFLLLTYLSCSCAVCPSNLPMEQIRGVRRRWFQLRDRSGCVSVIRRFDNPKTYTATCICTYFNIHLNPNPNTNLILVQGSIKIESTSVQVYRKEPENFRTIKSLNCRADLLQLRDRSRPVGWSF